MLFIFVYLLIATLMESVAGYYCSNKPTFYNDNQVFFCPFGCCGPSYSLTCCEANGGYIVGFISAGVVFTLMLVLCCYCCRRRRYLKGKATRSLPPSAIRPAVNVPEPRVNPTKPANSNNYVHPTMPASNNSNGNPTNPEIGHNNSSPIYAIPTAPFLQPHPAVPSSLYNPASTVPCLLQHPAMGGYPIFHHPPHGLTYATPMVQCIGPNGTSYV